MTAPKRRTTHLELVGPTQADVDSALYAGRLLEQAVSAPAIPKGHIKALWFMAGFSAGLLVAAIILLVVRWVP